jgi:hypothetical protein
LDSFKKQPSEKFYISIDFSNNMDNEEIINSNITATYGSIDKTSEVIGINSIDEQLINIQVKNGETEKDYKITAVITTNLGKILEKDVVMQVKDY